MPFPTSVKAFRGLSLAAILVISMALLYLPPIVKMEMEAYNMRLEKLSTQSPLDERLQIVGLDEESLQVFAARGHMWPWPRRIHGELVRRLTKLGVQSIFFDVLFIDPSTKDPQSDREFARALKESGRVFLASKFEQKSRVEKVVPEEPLAILKRSAKAVGHIDVFPDADSVVRWANLAFSWNGEMRPSVDILLAADLMGVSREQITFGKSCVNLGAYRIPTDPQYRMLINYYHNRETEGITEDLLAVRSYHKYLDPREPVQVKGALAIVGVSEKSIAGEDRYNTPQGLMVGPVIHGQIINTILTGNFIQRVPPLLNILFALAVALLLGLFLPKLRPLQGVSLTAAVLLGIVALNVLLFRIGWWLDIVGVLASCIVAFGLVASYQFMRTHKLFGEFVVPEVVDGMLSSDARQQLGGEEMYVSIMFTDIRGYTNLSEKMAPGKVMELLNEYHSVVVRIFTENDGRVIDYMGDAQMVLFGWPKVRKDHAYAAVRAAWQMQKKLDELRSKWEIEHRELFEVGCGITTGTVAVGLVGAAEDHKQYTAIGDSTNVAARLQGMSKQLEAPILIDQATYEEAQDRIVVDALEPVLLKGKSSPLPVFRVTGVKEG